MRRPVQPGFITQSDLAARAGCSQSLLNAWQIRYGWPMGHRSGGFRCYPEHLVELLRRVLERVRQGHPPSQIIIDGLPVLPAPSPAPKVDLDFGDIPMPATSEARDVRDRLILGLIQRHPGIVRWAAAQCSRIRPSDRGPAVLAIIAAYRRQVADHAWIDHVLET